MDKHSPIGVFDSGLGGISVLNQIHKILPQEDLIFLGDSQYNPYGTKTKAEIIDRCITICDFFMEKHCKAIVIACNTATSAAASLLRKKYPVDIIGMEPALKVAALKEKSGKIAVWATELTLKEEKFARLLHRFDEEHEIVKVPCGKLVQLVEQDQLDDEAKVQSVLEEYISQSGEDVDAIVLGCTHFVFFKDALKKLVPQVAIVDGNEGTARHLAALLEGKDLLNEEGGSIEWHNSKDTDTCRNKINQSQRLFERMKKI